MNIKIIVSCFKKTPKTKQKNNGDQNICLRTNFKNNESINQIISNAADSFLTRYYSSLAFSRVNETNNYQKRDTQNWFLLTSSRPW